MRALRRGVLIVIVVAFGWLQPTMFARSEVPAETISDPAQLVSKLVFALQTGDTTLLSNWLGSELLNRIFQSTDGTGRDARLVRLGAVSKVDAQPALTDLGGASFTARVTHQKGLSSWTIRVDDATHRIVTADYQIAPSEVLSEKDAGELRHREDRPPPVGGDKRQRQAIEELRRQLGLGEEAQYEHGHGHTHLKPLRPPQSDTDRDTLHNLGGLDPRIVDFLYVTTRKPKKTDGSSTGTPVNYTGERSSNLSFGAASVRIPEDHKVGRIELPVKWSLLGYAIYEGSFSENKHFAIRKIAPLTVEQWGKIATAKSPEKQALIFVHGYNTSFDEALYRNAQIIWDLQYPGLSVLFSWASAGNAADYFYDRDSAYLARDGFVKVLMLLRAAYHFEKIDVIAHSMGNLVVLDALSNYARTSNPLKIGQLIMAAPDVDRDQFVQMEPIVRKITNGITLYASSADKALALSRVPARVPRAGDVPAEGPIVLPDMETIDVTAIGDELFGMNHSEFASNRDIIDDIKLLISSGMRPPRLAQIRGIPEPPAVPKYWRYVP